MLYRRLLALVLVSACDDEVSAPQPDATMPSEVAETILDARVELDAVVSLDATLPEPEVEAAVEASLPDASDDQPVLDCSTLDLNYDNFGAEFLYLWCNFCHAKQEPTFTTLESVRLWAPAMRVATLDSRTMPPSGNANYLRDPQREAFARWLDCGAP